MRTCSIFASYALLYCWSAPPLEAQRPDRASAARARAVLAEGASDKDPEVRREVAVALSLVAARDTAARLLDTLARDKDHLVREAALVTIGELRDLAFLPAVRAALDDEVPEVVFAAARTLFRLKQPEGKEVLLAIVEKETSAKSGFLRAKMRGISRRLKTPKSAILFAMQQGVAFVPVPGAGEGVSAMTSLLGDADFSPRATALLLLSSERSPDTRRLIEQAFLDDDWSMRAAAVQIAGLHRDRMARARLVPLLDDTSRKVRYRAAAAFLRLNITTAPAH